MLQVSPETTLLIDEAYFDYVTDPSYSSQIPVALANPRVVVARTFSKAHGMAGLRIGYMIGRPETLRTMGQHQYGTSMNALGVAAAIASIGDDERIAQERNRNTEARDFTIGWFQRGRVQGERLAGELHLRGRQASARRVPRSVPRARRPRRPPVPADDEPLPHLDRDDR